MLDFSKEIIPYKSAGNVSLGDNINNYLSDIYKNHNVKISEYIIPDNEKRASYFIDETLRITTLCDGEVISIGCNNRYKGKCMGLFYSGQTLAQIIQNSTRQRVFHGCVIIDNNFGFSFELPAPYDEIGDSIEHLPLDLELTMLRVVDLSSWDSRTKSKTLK